MRGIQNQLTRTKLDHHNLHISDNLYIEKVSTNFRQKLNRSEDEQMLDVRVKVLIWGLFKSTSMKAAVHLGDTYNKNLVAHRNTNFDALGTFFDITQKLILDENHEILNFSTIEWRFTPWMRSSLLHDKVIKWATAKIHVCSDPVLCLRKCRSIQKPKRSGKISFDISNSSMDTEQFGIDGEPIEFEWNVSQDTLQ